jgi:pimeloyl-ACP methyl ester carboxylesterase
VEENNLTHNISILRKALGESATGQSFIETVPRIGYRFRAQVAHKNDTQAALTAEAPKTPTGVTQRQEIRFCTAGDGVRLAYATVGKGYPLIKAANWLNHLDFEWDSPVWRHWITELTRRHTVVRYDERGNGLSDWNIPDFTVSDWVSDLEAVVAAAEIEKFALLGISQGGSVAISYAVRHPERVSHLILYGAYSQGYHHRGQSAAVEARHALETLVRLDWGTSNPAFSSMFTSFYISENVSAEQQRWFNDLQRVSTCPENAARIMEACDDINVRSLLPRVSVPTIVFHNDRDKAVPSEEGRILAAEIPNARYVPLSSGNHLLLADEPAWPIFLQELGSFLGWHDNLSAR